MRPYASWNRYPPCRPAHIFRPQDRSRPLPPERDPQGMIAYGNGRSYSDVGLIDGGTLIHTRGLDRFIAFDAARGVLRAEAGILLDEILALVVPQGWFLAVTPGTRFVTLGGAIANDVHGKNHHSAGSFGCHVLGFELLRSDGARQWCSPSQNPERFRATIGGIGLTGLITQAEIQLRRIASPFFEVQNRRFGSLEEFFEVDAQWRESQEYTVAWIDCRAAGRQTGRGIYSAGQHAGDAAPATTPRSRSIAIPWTPPISPLNRMTLAAFNGLYFHRPLRARERVHYRPWLYPLDAVAEWHRLYGRPGFVQFQCAVPSAAGKAALASLLAIISGHGDGSPLAVLKSFGDRPSPGMLSFPRQGYTLALDFPMRGPPTLALLDRLYAAARAHGGRIYPAKDSTSPATALRDGYPELAAFVAQTDPGFKSGYQARHSLTGPA